jgi:hypothetical protein
VTPYNLTATNISWWSARISWTEPVAENGFTLYLVRLSDGYAYPGKNYSTGVRSINIWGLKSNTQYSYYIVAKCASGNKTSVTKTFKTK